VAEKPIALLQAGKVDLRVLREPSHGFPKLMLFKNTVAAAIIFY
jgi:hypothetical protein